MTVFVFLSFFSYIKAIHLREVAYEQSSSQSSVYGVDNSSNAVDGDLDTHMHTKREQSPYWTVDLGKIHFIKRIEIFNRKNGTILTGK